MIFKVSPSCANLGLRAGAIVFRGLRVVRVHPQLQKDVACEAVAMRLQFPDEGSIRSHPHVAAFHDLLHKVDVDSRNTTPSVHRLLSSLLKKDALPVINSLVDAYNLLSVRSLCSLGAHDLDKITSPVELRLLTGRETFVPLGQNELQPIRAGEYGYLDGAGRVLCRMDVLQADFSKVTTETTNALVIIEGTRDHGASVLRDAFTEAMELIPRYCGGTGEIIAMPE
jgi:DNA/RNA-binding domain of Phe-tRNA-synthetase-like protein